MSEEIGFKCSVCDQQRNNLNVKKSKLMPGMNLYLCSSCEEKKFEPRYAVILVGRSKGPEYVSKYIRHHRYVGKDILASELVK